LKNTLDLAIGATIDFTHDPEAEEALPLMIHGKSMHAGYIKSKGTILPYSELDNIVKTLKSGFDGTGAYILKDHGYKGGLFSPKSVDLLVGKITDASHDGKTVSYQGRIEDADIARKIKTKLVTASSIGIHIGKFNCSMCGREFSDPECDHRIGKEYPDGELHDIAKDYLKDMDGVPTGAIVCSDIRALEQSLILFPAIEGANVSENGLFHFSEDISEYLIKLDSEKEGINNPDLGKSGETFNKQEGSVIADRTMDEKTFDFDKVMGEITDLKTDKKLLEANVTTLETEKGSLETEMTVKDDKISDLNADIVAKDLTISTQKELIDGYKADETTRTEAEVNTLVEGLVALRVEKGLATKDYSESTLDMLKNEFELISEFKASTIPAGSVANENDPDSIAKKTLEAKEDLREMIFKTRKDGKELSGIRSEKHLKNRVD